MQTLVPAILFGMAGRDVFDPNAEAQPPHGEFAEPVERMRGREGVPLSLRIAAGSPNSRNVCSNTEKAYRSLVVDNASHASR
jgi:hypothetical protein